MKRFGGAISKPTWSSGDAYHLPVSDGVGAVVNEKAGVLQVADQRLLFTLPLNPKRIISEPLDVSAKVSM